MVAMLRLTLLLTACALLAVRAASAEPAHVGYPKSIAALGDSDSTGFDSRIPGRDSPENVWATGNNPAVNSHYLRILARNPRIKGHAYRFAKDGASSEDLARQAGLAVSARAEYVTREIGGNDACVGRIPVPLATFRARLTAALRLLAVRLPNSRVLVTSIPFDNPQYDAVMGPVLVAHNVYQP